MISTRLDSVNNYFYNAAKIGAFIGVVSGGLFGLTMRRAASEEVQTLQWEFSEPIRNSLLISHPKYESLQNKASWLTSIKYAASGGLAGAVAGLTLAHILSPRPKLQSIDFMVWMRI